MKSKKFNIRVEKDLCKGCGLCIWICPVKELEFSSEVNRYGYTIPKATKGRCIGCHLCEHICPDMAIWVLEE